MPIVIVPSLEDGSEITTYTGLVAAAEGALGRSVMSGAITALTADLNRRLRVREMIKETSQDATATPSDFLEAEVVKVGGTTYQPAPAVVPQSCTYEVKNGEFVFYPIESAPDLFLRYYAKLDVLRSGESNAILIKYPDLYLYGLLYQHSILVRDEAGVAAWGPMYQSVFADVVSSDLASRVDQRPMRVMPRTSA